ncbi:MAG: hypothetical protein NTZ21_13965 [Actinobacteria bacterium]|nr:hypothetical protein [Actinomycetota bacterium]
MSPSTLATDPYLDQLAHLIADHGIGSFESDISRLVVRLRAAGLRCPTVDLLADKRAPGVARERAFGMLVGLLLDDRTTATPAGQLSHAA